MEILFWHNTEYHRLPKQVKEYMRFTFGLNNEYLNELRCFKYDGILNEQPVEYIRIFNPRLAWRYYVPIKTNADLDTTPEALLYEGYIDDEGNVHIEDKRTMSYPECVNLPRSR